MPRSTAPAQKVVVAHDYLTQRGGAERVALEIARQVDAARIVSSVYRPESTFDGFAGYDVVTSGSPAVRALSSDPRRALPFLASAWSSMTPVDADAVVCSTSGWAHGLPVTDGTRKIVYCHNPARWLYQPEDYLQDQSLPVRLALGALAPRLKRWDARAAGSADVYLANSTSVAERIAQTYGIEAEVLHPPVTVDVDGAQSAASDLDPGFFLAVARPRGYKGIGILIDAFARMPGQHLAVVGLSPTPELPDNVRALGAVSEERLRWLYAHARALVSVSREDFGLTPIEANAFGTPTLTIRAGGFLDTVDEGSSGLFVDTDDVDAVATAVRDFPSDWERERVSANARRFSADSFGTRLREIIASVVVGRQTAGSTRP